MSRENQPISNGLNNITALAVGVVALAAATEMRRNQLFGRRSIGPKQLLADGKSASITLYKGGSLNLSNTTGDNVTLFPNEITREFGNCELIDPDNLLNINLSSAVTIDTKSGSPMFGSQNLGKGAYAATKTDSYGGHVESQEVSVAVGGFQLQVQNNETTYTLGLTQGDISVSPLRDLNGTVVHELYGHACTDQKGRNGEILAENAQYVYLTGNHPLFLVPDSMRPNLVYPDIVFIAGVLMILARLAMGRLAHNNHKVLKPKRKKH